MKRKETIKDLIVDAGNQLTQFSFLPDFEMTKARIKETSFKTLEDYTGKTREELEKHRLGVCDAYNGWVKDIQDPNLTEEKFTLLMEEAFTLQ